MTLNEFKNLKKGDKVIFQLSGKGNNGVEVQVADVWAEKGQIVVPRPDCGGTLCVYPYRHLKLVK